jgi:hypothetical protein
MIITFPYPPDRYDAEQARQLVDQLSRVFGRVLSIESASPFALLAAPDGGVWKVSVDNTGALTTVRMPLGAPVA